MVHNDAIYSNNPFSADPFSADFTLVRFFTKVKKIHLVRLPRLSAVFSDLKKEKCYGPKPNEAAKL